MALRCGGARAGAGGTRRHTKGKWACAGGKPSRPPTLALLLTGAIYGHPYMGIGCSRPSRLPVPAAFGTYSYTPPTRMLRSRIAHSDLAPRPRGLRVPPPAVRTASGISGIGPEYTYSTIRLPALVWTMACGILLQSVLCGAAWTSAWTVENAAKTVLE